MHRILHAPEVQEASTDSAQSVTHGLHDMDYSKPVSEPNCERCKAFLNKYVKLSKNAYQVLATRTVNQSNGEHSSLWHYSRARKDFESECFGGRDVALAGTIASRNEPYFSCSPDVIIYSQTSLEIKCPSKSVTALIESGKYNVISNNGQLILKPEGRNGYYTQVQLAMYCTGAKLCKFYVWCSDPEKRVCLLCSI